MNFLCPACRTPLPKGAPGEVVPCTSCGVQVDLTRLDTSPGTARLWPDVDLSGESLGEFRLSRRLASGGMGIVYEADGPQGRCAVKVLSALLAADPALRERFSREAAALRAIDHQGVVRILAEGEDRGFCWFAMEKVDGPDLRSKLEAGPLPADEVLGLASALLTTLEAVHGRGFVHRDIKPSNILIAASGPKLCDFGIARWDGSSTLTESAAVLGSLRYMAPEQRQGRTSPQSDLYSLGVVLFEALTGAAPGERELPRSAPAELRRLLPALLAERPALRPAGANAARMLLARPRRRVGIVAAAAAAAAVVGLAAGYAYMTDAPVAVPTAQKDDGPVPGAVPLRQQLAPIGSTPVQTAENVAPLPPPAGTEEAGAGSPAVEPAPSGKVGKSVKLLAVPKTGATQKRQSTTSAKTSLEPAPKASDSRSAKPKFDSKAAMLRKKAEAEGILGEEAP